VSGRPNIWPDPQPVNTPTSYRYRPAAVRDRIASGAGLVVLVVVVCAALSGCAPRSYVSCIADGCMSSIAEYEVAQ
jgi:hypothetical protein